MESPDHPLTLVLSLTILLSTYVTLRCITPPHASAKPKFLSTTLTNDRISLFTSTSFLLIPQLLILLLGTYHALLVSFPPTSSSLLCPNPDNHNHTLFTWNTHSILCLSAIITFSLLRLLAFRQLGPNFTFHLATPKKLITTGIYAYIQHPSYTAMAVVVVCNVLMFIRPDGVAGCWLRKEVVDWRWWRVVGCVHAVVTVGLLGVRVRDEEGMMGREFGREWEAWSGRTRRFVPGVF